MVAWGDFPTWVAAVATVGTFTGGLVILLDQGRQLTLLRREAVERQDDRVRAQARQISAWSTGFDGAKSTVDIGCANVSDEPAWRIQGIIFSDWTKYPNNVVFVLEVLGPKEFKSLSFPLKVTVSPTGPNPHVLPPMVVMFNDSAGIRWARNADGRLFKLDAAQAALLLSDIASQPEPWRLGLFEAD